MLSNFQNDEFPDDHDVCVVGSGPVGIAITLALERRGKRVLLVEAGGEQPSHSSGDLSIGHKVDPLRHARPEVVMCRALGGTSHWWGGRCVPYDDVDFVSRPFAQDAQWPISHADVARWYPAAAEYFGTGSACFDAPSDGWRGDDDIRADRLERWTPVVNMAIRHRDALATSRNICVLLGATVTELEMSQDSRKVISLVLRSQERITRIATRQVVLACGGLETTRLLLVMQQRRRGLFGGPNGPLGKYYMGHISGKIADIVLKELVEAQSHAFRLDGQVFTRRRFTLTREAQLREGVLNTAFWLDNPPFANPDHNNGVLSLAWLALSIKPLGRLIASEGVRLSHVGPSPYRYGKHIRNAALQPFSTAMGILNIIAARYLTKPPQPSFLLENKSGRYALHYHAEQLPNTQSFVTLSEQNDALGVPLLDVRLQYDKRDALSVLRSHELLDKALRTAMVGRLDYYERDSGLRLDRILGQAKDGFHQIGTTRMSSSAIDGVVDSACRVHGMENLYLAASSVLPTSGQANPTFLTVALALRLADHIANAHRKPHSERAEL